MADFSTSIHIERNKPRATVCETSWHSLCLGFPAAIHRSIQRRQPEGAAKSAFQLEFSNRLSALCGTFWPLPLGTPVNGSWDRNSTPLFVLHCRDGLSSGTRVSVSDAMGLLTGKMCELHRHVYRRTQHDHLQKVVLKQVCWQKL